MKSLFDNSLSESIFTNISKNKTNLLSSTIFSPTTSNIHDIETINFINESEITKLFDISNNIQRTIQILNLFNRFIPTNINQHEFNIDLLNENFNLSFDISALFDFIPLQHYLPFKAVNSSIQSFFDNLLNQSLLISLQSSIFKNSFDLLPQRKISSGNQNFANIFTNCFEQMLDNALTKSISISNDVSILTINTNLIHLFEFNALSNEIFDEIIDPNFSHMISIIVPESINKLESYKKHSIHQTKEELYVHYDSFDNLILHFNINSLSNFQPIYKSHFTQKAISIVMNDFGNQLGLIMNCNILFNNAIDILEKYPNIESHDLPLSPSKREMQMIHSTIDQVFNNSLDGCIKNCLKFEDGSIQFNDQNIDELFESDNDLLKIADEENMKSFISKNFTLCIIPLQELKITNFDKENKFLNSIIFNENVNLTFNEIVTNECLCLNSLINFSSNKLNIDKQIQNDAVLLTIKEIETSFDKEININFLKKYPDILEYKQIFHDINNEIDTMIMDTFSGIFDSIINSSINTSFSIQKSTIKYNLNLLQNYKIDSIFDDFSNRNR